MVFVAGMAPENADAWKFKLAEFRTWGIKDAKPRTQTEWDHALVKSLKRDQAYAASQPKNANVVKHPAQKNPQNRSALHTFDDVDYHYGVNPDGSF